jgi:capsular polysaccharide biosynthesis protein
MPNEDSAMGPMIAVRSLLATVRRRRRVWLIAGLVGLIVGASLQLVIPHKYSAVTDLYLAQPPGSDANQAMANNVSLLQTEVVAHKAVALGQLHKNPSSLLSNYSGLALSGNLMSIKYSGSSQAEAVSGARAVARAFLAVQAQQLHLQTEVLVRGLKSQITSANSAINSLNTTINNLSGAAPSEQTANQLTDLVNQRGSDASEVTQLQGQIQQDLQNEQSADSVSHVLDPAALVPTSTKKAILVDALSGLVAGLAVGLAAVIFGSLLWERAPARSNIAATLGAPVELSLLRYRPPRVMRKRRLSRLLTDPSQPLRMIERRLRGQLESAPGSAMAVVAVGTPEPAALAVGALALALSSEGHRVVVVDAADNRPLASILGCQSNPQTMETFELLGVEGPPVRVLIAPEDPVQMAQKPPPDDADTLLVLATLDAAFGAEHLAPWVTDAVMILSPRGISLARMGVSGEMLQEAGISLRSVILLGSDPEDDSSGTLSPIDLRFTSLEPAEPSK